MNFVSTLEGLVAGVWLGGYLFTTFVVSPALASLPVSDAERIRLRSAIGRRYGRLAGPLLVAWLALVVLQGLGAGNLVRLGLLLLLGVTTGVHGYVLGSRMQRLAEQEMQGGQAAATQRRLALQRISARITPLALVLSIVLALLALW